MGLCSYFYFKKRSLGCMCEPPEDRSSGTRTRSAVVGCALLPKEVMQVWMASMWCGSDQISLPQRHAISYTSERLAKPCCRLTPALKILQCSLTGAVPSEPFPPLIM